MEMEKDRHIDNSKFLLRFSICSYVKIFKGELLGFDKFIPPFATAEGRDILIGVNYTFGGAGIRDETGKQLLDNEKVLVLCLNTGFKVVDVGCCPVRSDGQCIPNSNPCKNRTEYVFWDAFHPMEALNQFTAKRSYSASLPSDAYPYDISYLVKIEL
ncbi:hypothetical protein SADUNF_Sadunf16G0187500 [Salix dunnii]|uniref:GDSL esterase/lipase n=1 Tax=Salix dunnii TaxID=1413687 RepID=A0A835JF33_9ROSI|nr:hypothetical protein SADUNF_Sadunf16G0187500 [Salix dunnii]